MSNRLCSLVPLLTLAFCATASADVMINEVFINPPGSTADETREYVELMGTPNMKLDGYAVAFLNGGQQKYYPLGTLLSGRPTVPPYNTLQEVDEFFSLDGLRLGKNGLLVIGIGAIGNYPSMLSDTNFAQWTTIWNGGLDVTGKLDNDGSRTVLLLRNRPGKTQADPNNAGGLRWGKDIVQDDEAITPVTDPSDNTQKDQWGNGTLDNGTGTNPLGQPCLDLKGESTLPITDDLEVVDEVSFEHDQGWEYDTSGRRADIGSNNADLKDRRVHNLGDPGGFNADSLSRVDYRTKGPGWAPVAGATGEMQNGNNWQDTATEQWVRGESVQGGGGIYFYSIVANPANTLQGYDTNVPTWLNDGSAPDFDFGTANTFQIAAGQVNLFEKAYNPGDVDRDGSCDASDIAMIASVFGNDTWIYSNSYSPNNALDPATETTPWSVDGTGDNGAECSDLQWVLNFQGNSSGHVNGVSYDASGAASDGVTLNSNAGVGLTFTSSASSPSGHALNNLSVGDTVDLTVQGRVSGGANSAAGQQNGIMQYIHDLTLSTGGVLKVTGVTALGSFSKTRSLLETLQGVSGDLGVKQVNGYTTSFVQGIGSASDLYKVTLVAVGLGSTNIGVVKATEPKFVASTPQGAKVGHTDHNGDPASSVYPSAVAVTVTTANRTVSGNIVFDLLNPAASIPTPVEIDVYVNSLYSSTETVSVDSGGDYSLSAPSGNLTLKLKHTHWLRQTLTGLASSGNLSGVDFYLLNGDAFQDNQVNLFDLNTVLVEFGAIGQNDADLDESGVVDLFDLNTTLTNFSLNGDS